MILAVFAASLLTAIIGVVLLIPRLHRAGITGKDMNKPRRNKIPRGRAVYPEVAEMGGLAMSFLHLYADAFVILPLRFCAVACPSCGGVE